MLSDEELEAAIERGREALSSPDKAVYRSNDRRARAARARGLQHAHGLTAEQARHALSLEPDNCEICNSPRDVHGGKLRFDHEPSSKPHELRGWLCHSCNVRVRDEDWILAATRYLGYAAVAAV